MKFATTAALSGLIASSLAVPTPAGTTKGKQTDDEYNKSWAGAVLDSEGSGKYTGVYGEFTVPVPKRGTAGETNAELFAVSSWLGIDGYSNDADCQGLWQAGVDSNLSKDGETSYIAWYEWYPANTLTFDDMPVTAGDVIAVSLTYSSFTEGTVTMENKSTGKKESKTVKSDSPICGQAAEWIMEDLSIDGSEIGLASYGNVTFSNAYATTKDGQKVGPEGAIKMDIQTSGSGDILTTSTITDDSVTVAYGNL